MSVAVSPDGHTLAIDLQGSIWILPATGGLATRITDLFNDARQPVWSPDGKWITFFSYREGSYDIWAIEPDGSHPHQLTWGPFDDREPAWSHDGTQLAFSSDRGDPLGSHYHIWVLDMRSGQVRQLTEASSEDSMPTWSPDDKEVAFASVRENEQSVWAVNVADGTERKIVSASGRVDACRPGAAGLATTNAARPAVAWAVSAARLTIRDEPLLRGTGGQGTLSLLPLRRRRQRPGPVCGGDTAESVRSSAGPVWATGPGGAVADNESKRTP